MSSSVPRPPSQSADPSFTIGALVAGLVGGLTIVILVGLIAAPLARVTTIPAEARLWIAYGVLLGVGLLSGFVVAIWKAPAGRAAATVAGLTAALLQWLMRVFLLAGEPYNRLVFGPIGLVSVVLSAAIGGWLAHLLDDDRLHVRFSPPDAARAGLWAASLWLSFELAGRLAGSFGIAPLVDNALAGEMLGAGIAMVIAAWIIAQYGAARGISIGDWEYRWTAKTIAFGAVAGVAAIGLMVVTAPIDQAIWAMPGEALSNITDSLQAGAWVAILFLIVNAGVAPICEEIAWRGVVQTSLMRAWSAPIGIGVTMILFAMKHVVLDASFARLTTLLMLGLVFGLARYRWGAGSSSVAHVLVNLYSTSYVIATT